MHTSHSISIKRSQFPLWILGVPPVLMLATVVIDWLYARFNETSFYLSESLLFSSYWLLLMPMLWFQERLRKTILPKYGFAIPLVASAAHLLVYPMLVYLGSAMWFEVTFHYAGTLQYALTQYLMITPMLYYAAYLIPRKNSTDGAAEVPLQSASSVGLAFTLTTTNNTTHIVRAAEVVYFKANPPYVNICHPNRTYLHNTSLRSLEKQLDPDRFVRIHRSSIVNLASVESLRTRYNGDYDIDLRNGESLRLSRIYAKRFKSAWQTHRLTTE